MRPKPLRYTIDWHGDDDWLPEVGAAFRRIGVSSIVVGYFRITSWHQVRVRKTRGEKARYRVTCKRLPDKPEDGAAFTVYDNRR